MGSLISTIGTRYLISHFNREFSHPRIRDLRTQPPSVVPAGSTLPAAAPIMDYFNDPNPAHDLFWITDKITHTHTSRSDHRCFLPEDIQRSPTAEARWKYFLTVGNPGGVLTAANHAAIKSAIYAGLSTMTLPGTWTYNRIEFDCVDGGGTQTVFSAPENDDNGIAYWKVVLVTPPMPAVLANPVMPGTNINLDPQP